LVSLKTIVGIGVAITAFVAYKGLGGAQGIGERIGSGLGGGISTFSNAVYSSFTNALNPTSWFGSSPNANNSTSGNLSNPNETAQVLADAGISAPTNWFESVGKQIQSGFSHLLTGYDESIRKDTITKLNTLIGDIGTVNAQGVLTYSNEFQGVQELPFDERGYLKTGQVGLGPETIVGQQNYSDIPTVYFDTKGNISHIGGI